MTSETRGPATPSAEFWEPLFAGSPAYVVAAIA